VHSPAGFGNVVNQTGVIATYLNVQPKAATTGDTGGRSGSAVWIAVAAVALVGASIVVLLRRRGSKTVEE